MRRTQIQLDAASFAALRRRAYEEGRSISAVVREIVAQYLGAPAPGKAPLTPADLPFVGAGRSRQGRSAPVSRRHDEALAEAIRRGRR